MKNGQKNCEFTRITSKINSEQTPFAAQREYKDFKNEVSGIGPSYLEEDRSSFIEEVILESDNVNEYGGTMDVRYLKNIRSIKDKINSCISCSENECPIIKQRLDHHLIKHHSSASNNKQRDPHNGSSSYGSRNSSLTSDGHTSTTEILKDANKYKKLLRNEILKWSQEIPIYPEQSNEHKKQNLVNKFIDKVNDMFNDIYEENYNFELRNKTDAILNSLPGLDKEKLLKVELKDNLLNRLNRLNKKFARISYKNKEKEFSNGKPEVKEVATSTLIDKLLEKTKKQHISTNTVQEYYNEVIGSDTLLDQMNVYENIGSSVNAQVQVQNSITNILNFEDNARNEREEFKETKKIFKHKVFDWMKNIMENANYKFVNTNVDKNFISNVLWDHLKQILIKKSPTRSDRLVLKIKILDLIDNLPLSTFMLDPIYRDVIADDLNSRLQSIQVNNEYNTEFLNYKAIQNKKEYLKNIVNDILKRAKLDEIENKCEDITHVLLKSLSNIKFYEKQSARQELYVSIKNLTNLSSIETFNLVNNIIIKATKDNKGEHSFTPMNNNKIDATLLAGTVSVFNSEQKTRAPTSSRKLKSIVSNQELIKLNPSEIIYINKIVETIKMWLDSLPKEFKSTEKKHDNIKYLAREMYDQIRLEEEGEVTIAESEKFKIFIVRKWLNRFDFFDNVSDSKPYIDNLIKDLKDIPKTYLERPKDPVQICCGSKSQSFEPEIVMKNLKY